MPKAWDEVQCDALSVAIKGLEKSYDEITKVFLGLDAKAQTCAVVSGIVIPATVGLIRWVPSKNGDSENLVIYLAAAAAVTLIASIIGVVLAIFAMRTRLYPLPYSESVVFSEARALFVLYKKLTLNRHGKYLNARMEDLAEIVREADGLRDKKASAVGRAQIAAWVALGLLTLTYAVYFPLHAFFPSTFT